MKKALLAVGVVLVLLAVPVTVFLVQRNQDIRQRAAPATTLEFSPQATTVTTDDEFELAIIINTGANQVTGADLRVVFDAAVLQAQNIQKGTFLPNILVAGDIGPGSASITLGAPSTTPGTGTGTLAIITFKALSDAATPVSIRFSQPETQIIGLGEQGDILVGTTPATVTVTPQSRAAADQPTETPTATPSAAKTTTIISPARNEQTNNQPTVTGTSFPFATITVTVTDTTPITSVVTADADGGWEFTPSNTLEPGSHTITATAQDLTSGEIETVTSTFVVEGVSTIPTSTTSGIPVAGHTGPTIATVLFAGVVIVLGSILLAL